MLRPARPEDAEAVAEILAEPEVSRWWGYSDVDGIGEEIAGGSSFVIAGATNVSSGTNGSADGQVTITYDPATDACSTTSTGSGPTTTTGSGPATTTTSTPSGSKTLATPKFTG